RRRQTRGKYDSRAGIHGCGGRCVNPYYNKPPARSAGFHFASVRAARYNTAMLPKIAITMGDPAGVGPEVIVAAWADAVTHERCRPFVLVRPALLRRAAQLWDLPLQVAEIHSTEEAAPSPTLLPCLAVGAAEADETPPGVASALG